MTISFGTIPEHTHEHAPASGGTEGLSDATVESAVGVHDLYDRTIVNNVRVATPNFPNPIAGAGVKHIAGDGTYLLGAQDLARGQTDERVWHRPEGSDEWTQLGYTLPNAGSMDWAGTTVSDDGRIFVVDNGYFAEFDPSSGFTSHTAPPFFSNSYSRGPVGFCSQTGVVSIPHYQAVYEFDVATNTWSETALTAPSGGFGRNDIPFFAEVGDTLYVWHQGVGYSFDMATHAIDETVLAPHSDHPQEDGGAAYYPTTNSVYLVGGHYGSMWPGGARADIRRYDVASNTFETVAHLPEGRYYTAAQVRGDVLEIYGGGGERACSAIERLRLPSS